MTTFTVPKDVAPSRPVLVECLCAALDEPGKPRDLAQIHNAAPRAGADGPPIGLTFVIYKGRPAIA